MKKLLLILLLIIPINVYCLDYPNINSKTAIIYDLTDEQILYEKDSNKKTNIASLTKIATTITAIENIEDLNKEVIITKEILDTVRWDASIAGLKQGDKVTYEDLLYASILPSGADATNALAISLYGSIDSFVGEMNKLTKKIEMQNTHFINVTGLDAEGHYSTANDIVKLLKYSLKNEIFKEIFTTKEYTLTNGLKVKSTIYSYNNSKSDTSKILGSKTGFTLGAGLCLASLMTDEGHDILVINLNAERINGVPYNLVDNLELINFIEKNYNSYRLITEDELIKALPVKYSKIDKYEIKTKESIIKYLPSDYDKKNFKIEYNGLNELSYKQNKKDKIGTVKYYYNNELITEEEIVLEEEIDISIPKIIKKNKFIIILISFIIITLFILKRKKKKNRRKRK